MIDILARDRAFVIAEAGTCHASIDPGRRLEKAMRYVHAAHAAGADAIKFQWFTDSVGPGGMFCWIDGDEVRRHRWHLSALPLDYWRQVKEYADACGIMLLASAFERETVAWLSELGLSATKIASRAARSLVPFASAPGPYLASTGMYPALDGPNIIVLECEANYPSTATWSGECPGFSDHSGTPWRSIDAIARRCRLVEVHFYVEASDAGPDYRASLTTDGLRLICEARDAFAGLR